MYTSGSNGTEVIGGINPSQIGYGSRVGSIDLNMSSSSYDYGELLHVGPKTRNGCVH